MWYVLNVCTVVASDNAVSDPGSASQYGQASIGLSVAGIVITVIVISVVFAVIVSSPCTYAYDGKCYGDRLYVGTYGYCSGVRRGNYCYYN